MRDIYNPPPAAIAWEPPQSEAFHLQAGDVSWLAGLILALMAIAGWVGLVEPTLWPAVIFGGMFVVLESWFSAITFLQRHPNAQDTGRWRIFLAALAPWCSAWAWRRRS